MGYYLILSLLARKQCMPSRERGTETRGSVEGIHLASTRGKAQEEEAKAYRSEATRAKRYFSIMVEL